MTGHRCHEKIPHPTKEAAYAALTQLYKAGKGNPDLNVYPCGDHGHIGHNRIHFQKRIRNALKSTPRPRRR